MLSSYAKLSSEGREQSAEGDSNRGGEEEEEGSGTDESNTGDDDGELGDEMDDGDGDDNNYDDGADYADPPESRDSIWESETQLPPLPSVRDRHSLIELLTAELANPDPSAQNDVPPYLETFEVEIPDNEVVIGAVPVDEIEAREREVEEARIRQAQLEADQYRQRESQLAHKEALLRASLLEEAQRRHDVLVRREKQLVELSELRSRRIRTLYQQCEAHLLDVLQHQQAQVYREYGDFAESRVPESLRRLRVMWKGTPQTLAVRVRRLNAVKDKLPRGNYVLVATLYDRLGGHAMHWSNWDREQSLEEWKQSEHGHRKGKRRRRPNFTRPFTHRGRYFHTDVAVEQRLDIVCPPESARRPANVIIFELFRLADVRGEDVVSDEASSKPRRKRPRKTGGVSSPLTDAVVGWGVLPMCTPDMTLVSGKYKIPLLRGELDTTMDKFRDIEQIYTRDLSSWLCNLYVQTVVKNEIVGANVGASRRFDVEMDVQRDLFSLRPPQLVENGFVRYARRISSPVPKKDAGGGAIRRRRQLQDQGNDPVSNCQIEASGATASTTLTDRDDETGARNPRRRHANRSWWPPSKWVLRGKGNTRVYSGDRITPDLPMSARVDMEIEPIQEATPRRSARAIETAASFRSIACTSDSEDWIFSSSDELSDVEYDTHETTIKLDTADDEPFDYEHYHFSVNAAAATETARHVRFHTQRKLLYLRHELLADLLGSRSGDKAWRTLEFWRLLLLLLFACWLRLYIRSAIQWLFLRARRVPVFDLQPRWLSCLVKYTWRSIPTRTEVALIVVGVAANALLFSSFALSAALAQKLIGDLPAFGSDFIVCVGAAMILDPLLVLIADVASHHYDCSSLPECSTSIAASSCHCVDGDWFKLYIRFQALEGSGIVGAFITLALFAALTCMSLAAFYVYLLHVHRNGRMLDVYRRIHGLEGEFFVPHDLELSLGELHALVAAARRWRGPQGAQRKVFVHDYVLTDPLDASFQEKSAHVAIYNVAMDGARQLHRHFLKASDGSVLELFGEVGTGDGGGWSMTAIPAAGGLHGQESDVTAALTMLYRTLDVEKAAPSAEDELSSLV